MDEKTETLRDIFIDVAEQDTVTEQQEESPGTLTEHAARERRVHAVIAEMRERYAFETDFDDDALAQIARGHCEGESDAEIAAALDADPADVRRARLDLHLLDEDDRELPVDLAAVREAIDEEATVADLDDRFDAARSDLVTAREVIQAEREMRRSNYRFRDEFHALLTDSDLSERLTESAKEDGLEDATEGIETNTSF